VMRFNRRNLGRLRQLIDCLNRGEAEGAGSEEIGDRR
jgi:hypothetical protein